MKIDGGGSLVDQLRMLKGIDGIQSPSPKISDGGVGGANKTSFSDMLIQKYEETNAEGVHAEQAIQNTILGKSDNPHETAIAVQKASVSLSLMLGVKERLERAYQEIMRMPV